MSSKKYLLLLAIVLTGISFRWMLHGVGITLDETVTDYVANSANLSELIERVKLYEFGPPIYFALMHFWVQAFGDQAFTLAIPSMVFGVLLIPAVYLFAYELFKRTDIALCSAFYVSVSPFGSFFSHEARTYSLLALICTVTAFCLIRALRTTKVPQLLALGVSTVLLLYTHYVGLFLIAMMVFTTLAYSRLPGRSENFRLLPLMSTLALSIFLFAFWLPVMSEHQRVGTFWVDREPFLHWPFVFVNNLAATLPLPWIVGLLFLMVALPVSLIVVARKMFLKAKAGELISFVAENKEKFYLVLNLFVPLSIVGYATPFILGYCRYLMPFAVFGWVLWAALTVWFLTWLANKIHAEKWNSATRTTAIVLLAFFLTLINFLEIKKLGDGNRSGLRQFAHDWKDGKYSGCALMVAPDFDSYTLYYYLSREQGSELPEAYYTYPRQKTLTPSQHVGYAESFRKPELMKAALDWSSELGKQGYKCLVVVADRDLLDSQLMPAKTRVKELLAELSRRYQHIGAIENYNSTERSFEVHRFNLSAR